MTKKTAIANLAAACAFAVLPAAVLAQSTYTVDPIETPPDMFALYPMAISSGGAVVGWWYGSPATNRQPFVYTQAGGYQRLPDPAGFAFTVPMDVSDAGVIVGYSTSTWSDETHPRGWKFENGQYSLFSPGTKAAGINAGGRIVGVTCIDSVSGNAGCGFTSDGPPAVQTFAAVGGYAGSMWRAIVVNDLGQMAYRTGATTAVFRDVDGATIALPPAPAGWTGIQIEGMNNAGQVIARWTRSTQNPLRYYSRGFVWSPAAPGVAQEFGLTAGSTRPKGINNLGQVVLESGGHDYQFFDCWLWSPEIGPVNLDSKTDYGDNLVLTDLYGINDSGQIVAGGDTITPPVSIYVVLNPAGTAGPSCGPQDFNGDGDSGTDQDIEAFFACLGGACCPTCWAGGADFNGDGDTGTDQDIEAFFRVLGGGSC